MAAVSVASMNDNSFKFVVEVLFGQFFLAFTFIIFFLIQELLRVLFEGEMLAEFAVWVDLYLLVNLIVIFKSFEADDEIIWQLLDGYSF